MLVSKLKEKWLTKDGKTVDLEKQARILRFLQRITPVITFLLFFAGVIWILVLPHEKYNKGTYISENALLPGQANVEYGYNDIRTAEDYVQKLIGIQDKDSETRAQFIHEEFRQSGFVSAIQRFDMDTIGHNTKGTNIFAIHKAPRSDGKEALILSASWISRTGEFNTNGIAALLSLAKLFKRNVYWAKDIILLITDQGKVGTQAWLNAYHGIDEKDEISAIVMPRSGAIQGVINLDFPGTQDYEALGIFFEGVNGQLPNLDLINTIVAVAERTNPPISVTLHDDTSYPFANHKYGTYFRSLFYMLQSMKYLVFGHPSSDAGLYLRIDAVTIYGIVGSTHLNSLFGFGRIGRLVESTFRSLNNLLEHFHQSFFFYLLPSPHRYVSISQYMPPAILFAFLYHLGTIPVTFNVSEKDKSLLPAYSTKTYHHLFAITVLTITHAVGVLIFGIIQPSLSRGYFGQALTDQPDPAVCKLVLKVRANSDPGTIVSSCPSMHV
ncbi:hypothetical protein G6F70_006567 [Rhizopus microsporus]|nr:hypothetical protein G6F71_004765 [Rhizopus microsporus]KAG1197505.1 hypothetical protein G6F70_006567 [Rhizopus microsporus]KAG1209319.1 hypothetical protein G6F69_006461 [Rhizopus microsporus]KAG1229018.1 hypothetical protein G6F67_007447 [Rhizopus microsporus]KAG1261005.1 hypothetical protein G6F68_007013 [Rhizopus microsporus]